MTPTLLDDGAAIGIEALDSSTCDAALARTTLAEIARSNTMFGGRAAVVYGVHQLLRGDAARGGIRILDVGAGSGDVLAYLVRRQGVPVTPIAADWHREAVKLCAARDLLAVACDARQLPLADAAVDVVVASQLLHHFNPPAAQRLVRELDRVARLGVVVADLHRARTADLWFRMGSRLLNFHEVTRHDGLVSLRRGFTKRELEGLLSAAGAAATVRRRPGYRLVAYWRTTHAHG